MQKPLPLFKEFKAFAIRGNVIDLAVGVIIGAAFGKIVTSLVDDIIMPVIGLATGEINFSDKAVVLRAASENLPALTFKYGSFINVVIQFVIVSFAIFLMVRLINRWKRNEPASDPTTKICPFCQETIHIKATRCPKCTSQLV